MPPDSSGPKISVPRPPAPRTAIPIPIMGSIPVVRAIVVSSSAAAIRGVVTRIVARPAAIEQVREMRRRSVRRAKKASQVSLFDAGVGCFVADGLGDL